MVVLMQRNCAANGRMLECSVEVLGPLNSVNWVLVPVYYHRHKLVVSTYFIPTVA